MQLPAVLQRPGLYWRTITHLRPEQLVHRVKLRALRVALRHQPELLLRAWSYTPASGRGWPSSARPLDAVLGRSAPSAEANAQGRFSFLGIELDLGHPPAWTPDAPLLWQYNLHYWEWAWSLVAHDEREWARASYAELWQGWRRASPFGSWPAWAPYPVSLRAWAWCGQHGALVAGRPEEPAFVASLAEHVSYLRHNLEYDVGGNHLVKNLKGLLGLAAFFHDQQLLDETLERLEDQIDIQVLPDGGHYERSPSYHCQVLGDLLDARGLLRATGRPTKVLDDVIQAMQRWLGAMLTSGNELAQMNDSWEVAADAVALLQPTIGPQPSAVALASSGYVVLRNGRAQCTVDAGDPCPPDLPAHAQADCLSFELAIDGRRVVVDPGTTTYEGPQRAWERSTLAHNTVTIDGADQTEVWGSFRAGRLAPAYLDHVESGDEPVVVAHHTGYASLPGAPIHRRRFRLRADSLEVTDELAGTGRHVVSLAIEHVPLPAGRPLEITCPPQLHRRDEARAGRTRTVLTGEVQLPVAWTTSLRF